MLRETYTNNGAKYSRNTVNKTQFNNSRLKCNFRRTAAVVSFVQSVTSVHNKAVEDSRLRPRAQSIASRHSKLRCVRRSLRQCREGRSWSAENMTSSSKPEVHNIALFSEEEWATAIGNTCWKFHDGGTCCLREMRADRQTHRHADRNTSHTSRGRSNYLHVTFACTLQNVLHKVAYTHNETYLQLFDNAKQNNKRCSDHSRQKMHN